MELCLFIAFVLAVLIFIIRFEILMLLFCKSSRICVVLCFIFFAGV